HHDLKSARHGSSDLTVLSEDSLPVCEPHPPDHDSTSATSSSCLRRGFFRGFRRDCRFRAGFQYFQTRLRYRNRPFPTRSASDRRNLQQPSRKRQSNTSSQEPSVSRNQEPLFS